MNITPALLGQIAGILAVVQAIPYIIGILRGKTKPARASYAIWSVMQVISMVSYIASGATDTKWVPIVLAFSAIAIFALSFKYGMGGLSKLDITCLGIAAVAIILWITTNDPALAVYASLIASTIAFIPVIKKSYVQPGTENTLSWTLYTASALFNVFALSTLDPVIALPPIVSLLCAGTIALLLLIPRKPHGHSAATKQ